MAKLNLWSQRANNDNFASFDCLTEITGDGFEQNLKETSSSIYKTCKVSSSVISFRDKCFWHFDESGRKPFVCKMEDVPETIQEEFIELINDSFAKDEFHSCNLEEF